MQKGATYSYEPSPGPLWNKAFAAALAIASTGALAILLRLFFGLGFSTNLNDGHPWGLWITWDVLVGTGLGCGGFGLALLVYALDKREFSSLMRPAILTGALGYSFAGFSVILDLGRYGNVYHLFMPSHWQFNSVLFEVALCIMAYTLILWIELVPAMLERKVILGYRIRPNILERWLYRLLFVVLALGMLLPIMHQSSLGSLLIIAGHKVHPLWQSILFPAYFLISAILMGYGAVVIECYLTSSLYGTPFEVRTLGRLSGIAAWLSLFYLFVRLEDLTFRGLWAEALEGWPGMLFVVENALYVAPIWIVANKERRNNAGWQFVAAILFIAASALYRFDTYWFAYNAHVPWRYFPSFLEILVVIGLIGMEVVLYLAAIHFFPILPASRPVLASSEK